LVRAEVAYQGYFRLKVYFLRHSLFQGGTSEVLRREVFERGRAAAVLPYDPIRDEVVLIRQFRPGSYAAGRHAWEWEIAAGIIEDGENAEALVRREAVEECGLELQEVRSLFDIMLSPGAVSESCHIFIGRTNTERAGGVFGLVDEHENILVKVLPVAEALAMLERQEIGNAVAVVALQWLALHREELRRTWR
jgi:ADP-ribose pyrophosphatase